MFIRTEFAQVDSLPHLPGLYEIHTLEGIALKVGIASDLRKRVKKHLNSKPARLKLKPNGSWSNPNDVESKQSILAKHLYFDTSITKSYDLTTKTGRQTFLLEQCFILYAVTSSREEARVIEQQLETTGKYRYVGRVQRR